jgi:hypothetical protein
MSKKEHAERAEQLLDLVTLHGAGVEGHIADGVWARNAIAAAQVHALLSLARPAVLNHVGPLR